MVGQSFTPATRGEDLRSEELKMGAQAVKLVRPSAELFEARLGEGTVADFCDSFLQTRVGS